MWGVEGELPGASFPSPGASANKHKPWIEAEYQGIVMENDNTVLLNPPLFALDKDAPLRYAGNWVRGRQDGRTEKRGWGGSGKGRRWEVLGGRAMRKWGRGLGKGEGKVGSRILME